MEFTSIEAAVRPVYKLYGKETDFESVVYPGQGHLYTPEMSRRPWTGWINI